jgi:DNA-binding FadR family transcriptional regulator
MPMFGPLRSHRVYERVAARLRELIERGELHPGERLPAERELAAQFRVSRPSVREALIALETGGWIEVRAGDASYVSARHLGDLPLPAATLEALSCGALEQLETSALIEAELAAGAAQDPTTARPLAALLETRPERRRPGAFPAPFTRAFHEAAARLGGNALLASLAIALWQMRAGPAWEPHRRALARLDDEAGLADERRQLVVALEAGNRRDARAAMARMHLAMRDLLFG